MAFTRSGVRSPSPPLNSRVGEVGEVGEVGAVETRPTERLDLAAARGNSSVGRAQPCQGWGRGFESRFPLWEVGTLKVGRLDGNTFHIPTVQHSNGFSSDAGWSSLVARRAHNPEVVGSNPTPAITNAERGMRNAELAGSGSLPRSNFRVPRFGSGG